MKEALVKKPYSKWDKEFDFAFNFVHAYMHMSGFDKAHACLTLRMHVTGQKALTTSIKYKIAIEGLQTLTKCVQNPENSF